MTDKLETIFSTSFGNPLDQAVEIQTVNLGGNQTGAAFFHDGESFVFGLIKNGSANVVRMSPEQALAVGQMMQEAAILEHADVAAVHRAVSNANDQTKH